MGEICVLSGAHKQKTLQKIINQGRTHSFEVVRTGFLL